MFSRTHTPRLTGDVLILDPGDRQKASLPQQSSTVVQFRSERHATELRPVNIGNAVMFGEPLIEESIVRGQQINDVAVLTHDAFKEHFRFTAETLPQLVVPVGIELRHPAMSPANSASTAIARRSSSPEPPIEDRRASAAPAARARLDCSTCPWLARLINSSSGMLLHRKNDKRDANSRSVMR